MSLTTDEQFFYDHAGWFTRPDETRDQGRERCARELARVDAERKRRGWWVATETDPDGPMEDDAGSVEGVESGEYVCLIVALFGYDETTDRPQMLASIGNVIVASSEDPYVRVLGAELASEALADALA